MFGLFNKRTPKTFDPVTASPHAKAGLEAILSDDWRAIDSLYQQQNSSDRYKWISILSEVIPMDHRLPENLDSAPSQTVLGGLYVGLSKRARGSGIASTVSDDAAHKMFDAASRSYELLFNAGQVSPQDSTIIAFHLRAAIVASDDSELVFTLMKRLDRCTEPTLFAPVNFLTHQLEKWMGSRDDMWQIAERYSDGAPNPSYLSLKAFALIEDWLWHTGFEDDADAKKAYSDWRYSGGLKTEINELDDEFWSAMKAFEGDIPASEQRYAHHQFAFLHYYFGDKDRLTAHVDAIGEHLSLMPWGYRIPDENKVTHFWNKVRKRAGLEGFYAD